MQDRDGATAIIDKMLKSYRHVTTLFADDGSRGPSGYQCYSKCSSVWSSGAAIDVLEQEPPIQDDLAEAWRNPQHPAYHRLIINPHAAFYSEEGVAEIRVRSAQACLRVLEGKT